MQHGKSERKNELHMCMLFGSVRVPLGLDVFLVVRQSVCGCLVLATGALTALVSIMRISS